MKTHTYSCAAVLTGVMLFLAGCRAEKPVNAAAVTPVQKAAVDEVEGDTSTHSPATLEPDTTVEMAFKVAGYVDSLLQVGERNLLGVFFFQKGAPSEGCSSELKTHV